MLFLTYGWDFYRRDGNHILNTFPEQEGEIWLSNIVCSGREESVADCQHDGWGVHKCGHFEDVAVSCGEPPSPTPGPSTTNRPVESTAFSPSPLKPRLVDGPHSAEGYVELGRDDEYNILCSDNFENFNMGQVVCSALGHADPTTFELQGRRSVVDKVWKVDMVNCSEENSTLKCLQLVEGSGCSSNQEVYLRCLSSRIRLAGGPGNYEGRLEVFVGDKWGMVCDNINDGTIAQVACKSLGFNGSYELKVGFHPSELPYVLGGLKCTGTELDLFDCPTEHQDEPGTELQCGSRANIGVKCANIPSTPTSVPIRLTKTTNNFEGRLEVKINNTWGTICNDGFDEVDASVACYMLGFGRAGARVSSPQDLAFITEGSLPSTMPIWMDELNCLGWEESLMDCLHHGLGNHNCDHDEDVYINCSRTPTRCPPGWLGKHCTDRVDYCSGEPCENRAACTSGTTGPVCECVQVKLCGS